MASNPGMKPSHIVFQVTAVAAVANPTLANGFSKAIRAEIMVQLFVRVVRLRTTRN